MELTLFVIVGAIAVIAAAMMLISENAIYSALFLILNFACIAFLFLMLNAPFLAMVQITVYAGAIMVLFLFVIMLLGAERVLNFSPSQFRWLTPMAIVLALAFLITVSVAIIGGEIEFTEQQKITPHVRVLNVFDERDADDVDAIDAYLDDTLLVGNVDFGDASEYDHWESGLYTLRIFTAGDDPATAEPLVAPQPVELNDGEAVSLVVIGRAGDEIPVVAVATHEVEFNDDKDTLWLTVVNAVPTWADGVDVRDGDNDLLIENVGYGMAVEAQIDKGKYDLGVYQTGNNNLLIELTDRDLAPNDTALIVFAKQWEAGNAFSDLVIDLEAKSRASFGSPTHIGRLLFSRYVLPFEMVSLLLLVSMIGAIVLTHEALGQRRQVVRRMANPPTSLDDSATSETGK